MATAIITTATLIEQHKQKELAILARLQNVGLIPYNYRCVHCKCQCYIRYRKRDKNEKKPLLNWRCNKCSTFVLIKTNTFFELYRYTILDLNQLIDWPRKLVSKAQAILAIEENSHCRQVIADIYYKLR
jgi:hypothetical protein